MSKQGFYLPSDENLCATKPPFSQKLGEEDKQDENFIARVENSNRLKKLDMKYSWMEIQRVEKMNSAEPFLISLLFNHLQ